MRIVQGEVRVHPEDMAALKKLAAPFIAATKAEKGLLHYGFAEDFGEPGLVHVVERWATQPDLDAHAQAPHTQAFLAEFGKLRVLGATLLRFDAANPFTIMG